jgi:hypothetical protein
MGWMLVSYKQNHHIIFLIRNDQIILVGDTSWLHKTPIFAKKEKGMGKTNKQRAKEAITLKQAQRQASLFFKRRDPGVSVSVPRAISPQRSRPPLQDISPNANKSLVIDLESSPFKVFFSFNCSLIYI